MHAHAQQGGGRGPGIYSDVDLPLVLGGSVAGLAGIACAATPCGGIALYLVSLGMLAEGDVTALAGGGALRAADNVANGPKLAQQLQLQSANSAFTSGGGLSQGAIQNATKIIDSSRINNPAIPAGMSKYTTQTFQSPSGNFQTHFYKNDQTGDAFYGFDYKAIFN